MPRFYCPAPLEEGATLALPPGAARHVQVLRMQPGDTLTLFNGLGGSVTAEVLNMGRSNVDVRVTAHDASDEREAAQAIHLAVGMPANERMDWLVEKATELGAASIQPLMTAHSVLRLSGERADKKRAHWEGIAVAACEQCGRNRVPTVHPVLALPQWLQALDTPAAQRWLLAVRGGTQPLGAHLQPPPGQAAWVLSGPEGGLAQAEEELALQAGFLPVTLGPRVLRAETAPLAALARLT